MPKGRAAPLRPDRPGVRLVSARRRRRPTDDGPIWMVNLMAHRERADYGDGAGDLTGEEADRRYAEAIPLQEIGAEVVFFADVESQLLGDTPRWDQVGVVRYPSRRAFIDMQRRDDFKAAHQHKEAALAETIVIAGVPIASPPLPDDAPAWDAVPHPPTDEDPAVMVLHVLKYKDDERRGRDGELHGPRRAGGGAARRAGGGVVRGRGDDRGRRAPVAPGPVQRLPEQGGVHGGGVRPGAPRGAARPSGGCHRGHLHDDPAPADRPPGRVGRAVRLGPPLGQATGPVPG